MSGVSWIDLLQLVLVSASLLATVLIAWFVARQTQNHFMVQHSQAFIERFNGDAMSEHRHRVDGFQKIGRSIQELLDGSAADPHGPDARVHESFRTSANFFQELGAALRHRMVKESMVWDDFGGLVKTYWRLLLPYIEEVRLRDNRPTLFCDFEDLALRMTAIDRKMQRRRAPSREAVYLFGYGSLVHPKSAERTLGRPLDRHRIRPCWLNGYHRSWSVYCWVESDSGEEGSIPAVFLNIKADAARRCNGVCFPVSPAELRRFDRREKPYRRVDVTDQVQPAPDRPVYAYVGAEPWTQLPADAKVPLSYQRLVEEGLAYWGSEFAEDFTRCTEPHKRDCFQGEYRFTDGPQNAALEAAPTGPED